MNIFSTNICYVGSQLCYSQSLSLSLFLSLSLSLSSFPSFSSKLEVENVLNQPKVFKSKLQKKDDKNHVESPYSGKKIFLYESMKQFSKWKTFRLKSYFWPIRKHSILLAYS